MAQVKNYVWVFPIFGAVLAFISIVTPAASMNYMGILTANLWLWGLYNYNFGGILVGTDFMTELMVLIPSLIATVLVALGGILLIGSGIGLKKNIERLRNVRNFSIIAGFLILVAEVLWLIMVPTFFPIEYYLGPPPPGYTYNFWSMSFNSVSIPLHSAGFGVIGGFMSAGISLGGAGAAHYYSKERPEKIREKKEPMPPTEKETPSEKPSLEFCPECGAEIEDPSIKFCGKCGFDFTSAPMTQVP